MAELIERVYEVVARPTDQLVAAFYDPSNGFAGTTFDDLPNNPPNRFTVSDLLAVSLLDVAVPPAAVRTLLDSPSKVLSKRLAAVPTELDLWQADDDVLARMQGLWDALDGLPGVGPTRKSKLLARKRPRLIPIVDSVIRRALPLGDNSWVALRDALGDKSLRRSIEKLRPAGVGADVSTLRLLDTAVWMRCSEGKGARRVRQDAGLPLAVLTPRGR